MTIPVRNIHKKSRASLQTPPLSFCGKRDKNVGATKIIRNFKTTPKDRSQAHPRDRNGNFVSLPNYSLFHIVKLPAHPVRTGQARRGFPERQFHFILCPFLPTGRQGPCLSRFGGTGHVPVNSSQSEFLFVSSFFS
jgi:hypothetical protein